MGLVVFEVLLIFLLLIINGIFSMSELSIVSARRIRLQQQAESGNKGAKAALELAESPNDFLSTVQIGITSVGILSGAFGGATIAQVIAEWFNQFPALSPYGVAISFVIVVAVITYFSIIIGELIPKSFALNSPEKIASIVARPMQILSRLSSPVVWLLSAPTSFVLRFFRVQASVEPPVTDEEIKGLIDAGTKAGVFEETEQNLIESVIHLGDYRVASVMTPRTKILWLDIDAPLEKIKEKLINSRYSRLPVAQGSLDNLLGYAPAKHLLGHLLKESELSLRKTLKQPIYVPETNTVLELLECFKEAHTHFAVVVDEFGGVEGVVTMNDVLETIVGDFSNSQHSSPEKGIVPLPDGSWILDGRTPIVDFKLILNIKELEGEERDQYHTLAGFVMVQLGRLPEVGETFEWNDFEFKIVGMERNRLDKVLITALSSKASDEIG
jgi:putative hemolysin